MLAGISKQAVTVRKKPLAVIFLFEAEREKIWNS